MEKSAEMTYKDLFDLASHSLSGFAASPTEWSYTPFTESPMTRDEAFKNIANGKKTAGSKRKKLW